MIKEFGGDGPTITNIQRQNGTEILPKIEKKRPIFKWIIRMLTGGGLKRKYEVSDPDSNKAFLKADRAQINSLKMKREETDRAKDDFKKSPTQERAEQLNHVIMEQGVREDPDRRSRIN